MSAGVTNCEELKKLLKSSLRRNYADALLLSGGLDSSILACMGKPKVSFTISVGDNAPDLEYATRVAARHMIEHVVVKLSYEELLQTIEELIKILKTFSPLEIRNSSVVLAGIKAATDQGYKYLMTGDGGDELFAGYNYLSRFYSDIGALDKQLHKLWESMHFSSIYLGRVKGVGIRTPLLDSEFIKYAKAVRTADKIGVYKGLTWGKFILRKCYEPDLGEDIVWRPKLAQEQGAGTNVITSIVSEKLDSYTFALGHEKALAESTKLRDKEHLYYYSLYRKYFPAPGDEACNDHLHCPECRACFTTVGQYCNTCGSFPVTAEI
ncbi:MAG TPA: asparagine synthase-related protein [Nitrososphaeraceae archaeon]|nr:asparagine synthase-related protein [Nitrososphaeraceae archaeon]